MNKNPDILEARRLFIRDRIARRARGERVDQVIRTVAAELFVSQSTIWKDFQRESRERNGKRLD